MNNRGMRTGKKMIEKAGIRGNCAKALGWECTSLTVWNVWEEMQEWLKAYT